MRPHHRSGRAPGRWRLVVAAAVVGALAVPGVIAAARSTDTVPVAGLASAGRIPYSNGGVWTTQQVMLKPFAPTSPWNSPIPAGARFTRTATFAGDSGFMTSEQNSVPLYFAGPGDPILTFTVAKPSGAKVFQVRGPAGLTPANDADLEITIVDLGTNHVWDFMGVARTGATTFSATAYGDGDLNGTGFGYFPAGGGTRVRAGVRASGASWLGGLVTGENLAQGAIDHALAIAVASNDLKAAFVPPAVELDSNGASTYTGTLPMGTRLGIPSGTLRPGGMSGLGNMIFDALATYGGYVIDRATGFNLFADARTVPTSVLIPVRRPMTSGPGSDLQKIVPLVQIVG